MNSILLIEDNLDQQVLVKKILERSDLQVHSADCMVKAKQLIEECQFDIILLDIGLPDCNGMEFCMQLQSDKRTEKVPVIFITGKQDIETKVAAFSLGAEDYIVKPFNVLEFKARIEAKLKKVEKQNHSHEELIKGKLLMQAAFQKAFVQAGGTQKGLELTSKEFRLLYFLAHNEGRLYSREQLLAAVWGENIHILDRTVDAHVCSLRKKLGDLACYVQSVPGAGYRFQIDK